MLTNDHTLVKKILSYLFLGVLVAGGIYAYVYWQQNKKSIIKNAIEKAVTDNTDSLYYIHYDSSRIDEVNGNAVFYNVSLQSDEAQKKLLTQADSLPDVLFTIKVEEVNASGVDVPGLLDRSNVSAKKIILKKPYIQILNTGKDKPETYSYNDTVELYRKILGRLKSIKADSIYIIDGTVLYTDITGKPYRVLEHINIAVGNFLIDSTGNHSNIISYFIKDLRASVENIQLVFPENNSSVNIEQLEYDAAKKILKARSIRQYKINDPVAVIDLKNIQLSELNTNSFIYYHQFKAGALTCDGGLITIYKKEITTKNRDSSIQLSSDLVRNIQVGTIKMGNTKVIIENAARPGTEPFVLNDVRFEVFKIMNVYDGTTVSSLVNNSEWKLYSSGFSFFTKDKLYKLSVTGIEVDKRNSTAYIKQFAVIPQLSEEAFMKRRTVQGDRFDLNFYDIRLQHTDISKLLNENKLEIQYASLRPVFKIYNDRLLPYDTRSKVGNYPHQALQKLGIPVYIKQLQVRDGHVTYKERGRLSGQTGSVVFSKLNGTISNISNIKERIKANAECRVVASASFLDAATLSTEWRLPLAALGRTFTASGEMNSMNAVTLNQIAEPLGMLSVKKGHVNKIKFNMTGNDYSSRGNEQFLYNDLKLELLEKNKQDVISTKNITTFLTNMMVKDSNPKNDVTRPGVIDFSRDTTKSFFHLLWKSVFDGAQSAATGKN
jgi:hypothetical protein